MSINKLKSLQNLLALSSVTLVITVWSTVSFLAYQNSQLKKYFANYQSQKQTKTLRTLEDIKEWKTYKNEKYGYSINYPNSWEFSERDDNLATYTVLSPTDKKPLGFINISVSDGKYWEEYRGGAIKNRYQEYSFNGISALKFDEDKFDKGLTFKSPIMNYYFAITYGYGRDNNQKQLMDQILSTFEFTE